MPATLTILKSGELAPPQRAFVEHYTEVEFGDVPAVQAFTWSRLDRAGITKRMASGVLKDR